MKLDEPSYFEIQNKTLIPNDLDQFSKSPQQLNQKQMEQAEEIMMKTSPNGKAVHILQKYWQVNQPGADGAESIFSAEVPPPIASPPKKEAVMALVASDQTITIKDQEQMME